MEFQVEPRECVPDDPTERETLLAQRTNSEPSRADYYLKVRVDQNNDWQLFEHNPHGSVSKGLTKLHKKRIDEYLGEVGGVSQACANICFKKFADSNKQARDKNEEEPFPNLPVGLHGQIKRYFAKLRNTLKLGPQAAATDALSRNSWQTFFNILKIPFPEEKPTGEFLQNLRGAGVGSVTDRGAYDFQFGGVFARPLSEFKPLGIDHPEIRNVIFCFYAHENLSGQQDSREKRDFCFIFSTWNMLFNIPVFDAAGAC